MAQTKRRSVTRMISASFWAGVWRAITAVRWWEILKAAEITFWAILVLFALVLAPTWAMVMLIIPIAVAIGGTAWWAIGLAVLLLLEVALLMRRRSRRGKDTR